MAAMAVSPFAATMEAVSATVCESLATLAAAILAFDARLLRSDWVAVAESAEDCALSMALLANAAFVCASAVMDSNVLMAIAAFMVVAVSSKSTTASGYCAESVSASDWVEAWRTFNSWEPAISFGTNVPASTSTRSAYATTWVESGTST